MTDEDEAFEDLAKRQGDWGLQGSRKHQIMRYENDAMREVQRLGQEIEQDKLAQEKALQALHNENERLGLYKDAYAQPEQEPVAYDKTEMNCFVQDLYDKKMKEGKHGHYETMFHVVHQAIKRVPPQRTEQKMVMWPCLIDTADFSKGTVTVVMQCEDYKVSAGTHWLSTTPPKENT